MQKYKRQKWVYQKETITQLENKLIENNRQLKKHNKYQEFDIAFPAHGLYTSKPSMIKFSDGLYNKLKNKEKLKDKNMEYLMPCYHIPN